MKGYRHILLAADFSDGGPIVAERCQELARYYQARMTLLHVVESFPIVDSTYGPIMPFEIDLTEQMVSVAKTRLAALGDELAVPADQRLVEVGSAKVEIVRIAEELEVDLIVLGSHGRHGVGLLLGSTASSVIHHANCDVLAVRLKAT
jgi:universal stress protein A